MEKKTLILIDGHALAFRMYFALERTGMKTTNNEPTWAVYGFFKAVFDLLKNKNINPDAIAVAFDVGHQTFRVEQYADYKANREQMPDTLHSQLGLIIEGLKSLNIPIYTKEGFEADDVIGTITAEATALGHKTYILTGDQDAFQLIDKKGLVSVLIPSKGELVEFDRDKVYEKLQVYPEQVIDYKALRGDTSDNIPGIKGIGEKSAAKLLNTYENLENIYKQLPDFPENALKKKLVEGEEIAQLSQFLATIKKDVAINFDFEHTKLDLESLQPLSEFLRKVQFYSFLKNIEQITKPFKVLSKNLELPKNAEKDVNNGKDAAAENKNSQPTQLGFFANESLVLDSEQTVLAQKVEYQNVTVDTDEQLDNLLNELKNQKLISLNFQMTTNEFMYTDLVGIAVAFNPQIYTTATNKRLFVDKNIKSEPKCYYIPLFHEVGEQLDMEKVLSKLKPFFESESLSKVIQNAKLAVNLLRHLNIPLKNVISDTMLASYIKDPARKHEINVQSLEHLNYFIEDEENILGKGRDKKTMSQIDVEHVSCYACDIAVVTLELAKYWENNLDEQEKNILYDIEMPLTYVLADMEYVGISVDLSYLDKLSDEINKSLTEIESVIYEEAGEKFNINSPKKVGEILFDKLQLKTKKIKKTKTGYSTGANVLEELAQEFEIAKNILQQRHLTKLKTTYVDTLPTLICPIDKRIHTTYNQTVTTTGRLSSSSPNLQNIPIRTKLGNRIRAAFVPKDKENYVILSADYSQVELRLLAHISQDDNLIAAFNSDEDIHTQTAAKVFEVPIEAVTKEMRSKAKAVNFGIIYGQTRYGLAKTLKISSIEAQLFIDKYFATYPKVKDYMQNTVQFAYAHGFVETTYGRKRYLQNELTSSSHQIKEFAERAAINQPLQGTAADLIKVAMVNLHKKLQEKNFKTKIILQVHDELVLEVYKPELDEITKLVNAEMELQQPLLVPLKIDVAVGHSWMEGDEDNL